MKIVVVVVVAAASVERIVFASFRIVVEHESAVVTGRIEAAEASVGRRWRRRMMSEAVLLSRVPSQSLHLPLAFVQRVQNLLGSAWGGLIPIIPSV